MSSKVEDVTHEIRQEIKEMEPPFNWPVSENELFTSETKLPQSLYNLLKSLLVLRRSKKMSKRIKRLIMSIGEDLLYTISNGKI